MYWKVPVPSTANITVHSEVMLTVGYVIFIRGIRVEPVLPVGLSRYFVSDGAQEKPFFYLITGIVKLFSVGLCILSRKTTDIAGET
jgi:hypothetical protein